MADEGFKRKLAAILSADVVGYSRLMENNEEATIKSINAYRKSISTLVEQHRGRVVDTTGDNLMAEFSSVVDAVQCAVEIQKELSECNAELPDNRRMLFRIGVNLGDVVAEDGRIYGDGVNIAARLESLAEAGGICISRTAYGQVKNKLNLGYEYLGEHSVKNISEPVHVYKVLMGAEAAGKVIGEKRKEKRRMTLAAVIALLIAIGGLAGWYLYIEQANKIEPASVERMAFPLPDKPSIAVLPFDNMSDDPKKEYLSDGMTEQIITSLSKMPNVFVISRTSTFSYKGKPVKVQQVAEELGIRYVLEGSVQQSGDKIRITAQLIDALTGRHLWAERYERNYEEIFALQDEITLKILSELQVKLTAGERIRFSGYSKAVNLEAFEKAMEALTYVRAFNPESNATARRLAEESIQLDPNYPYSYNILATVNFMDVWLGMSKSRDQSLNQAIELLEKSIVIDENSDVPYSLLCHIYGMKRQFEKAIAAGQKAIEINPNSDSAYVWLAMALRWAGRSEEAIKLHQKAMRLCPFPPAYYYTNLGSAYLAAGRCEEAIKEYKKALHLTPKNFFAFQGLSVCHGLLGQEDESRAAAAEMMKINPKITIKSFKKKSPDKNRDLVERWANILRKAGTPEHPPLPLPDKPSIAVLAFDNLSDDPEQEYIADGIAENIITTLSKIHELFVISRNSSFIYKGKPIKVQKVSEELGVRYVLEGSVQRSGDLVRVIAQLNDAIGGQHLWSQRYDRNFKDIFELQDELASKIANSLRIKLVVGDQGELWQKDRPSNLQFNEKVFEARYYSLQRNKEANVKAKQLYKEAIDLEPDYFGSYAGLAYTHYMDVHLRSSSSPRNSLIEAVKLCNKAIALDESQDGPHFLLGLIYAMSRKFDRAIAECERAIALNPNSSGAYEALGRTLVYAGRPEEALDLIRKGMRLNPLQRCRLTLGSAYREAGQYEEALTEFKKCIKHAPNNIFAHTGVTYIYARTGRYKEARDAWSEVLKIDPKMTAEKVLPKRSPYGSEHRKRTIANFHKAGIK